MGVMVKVLVAIVGVPLDPALLTAIRFTMMAALTAPFLAKDLIVGNADGMSPDFDSFALASAASELAVLGTAGTLLNTWGIEHTTAVRAALMLSSINIFTPLLSALIGSSIEDRRVAGRTWLGCGVSCVATAYAVAGGGGARINGSLGEGDFAVLAAAVCYAAVKVRLAAKARAFPPEVLAAGRLASAAVLAWIALGALSISGVSGVRLTDAANLPPEAWGVLLLSALVPGVAATVLQARGQRVVPPAEAQTLYAVVPLFAGLYDFLFLQDPLVDREIFAGLALVAAAALSSPA